MFWSRNLPKSLSRRQASLHCLVFHSFSESLLSRSGSESIWKVLRLTSGAFSLVEMLWVGSLYDQIWRGCCCLQHLTPPPHCQTPCLHCLNHPAGYPHHLMLLHCLTCCCWSFHHLSCHHCQSLNHQSPPHPCHLTC